MLSGAGWEGARRCPFQLLFFSFFSSFSPSSSSSSSRNAFPDIPWVFLGFPTWSVPTGQMFWRRQKTADETQFSSLAFAPHPFSCVVLLISSSQTLTPTCDLCSSLAQLVRPKGIALLVLVRTDLYLAAWCSLSWHCSGCPLFALDTPVRSPGIVLLHTVRPRSFAPIRSLPLFA